MAQLCTNRPGSPQGDVRRQRWRMVALTALVVAVGPFVSQPSAQLPNLIISEFRLRGPAGANDEFIEVYNPRNSSFIVTSEAGSTGFAVVASDGVARFVIPNGTIIPPRGHYLGVNTLAYSLVTYPASTTTNATGDITYTTGIADNAGIALFNTSLQQNFMLANRLDAVGSTSESNTLYREGDGYAAIGTTNLNHSFHRNLAGGFPQDTNDNGADFLFADAAATATAAGQRLGGPGPENLSSPVQGGTGITVSLLDPGAAANGGPNYERNTTPDLLNSNPFGTLTVRRTLTNNTGVNVTRLRVRYAFITTAPSLAGYGDLRPRTSGDLTLSLLNGNPVGVVGTTLEQTALLGGMGVNGSVSVPTITSLAPLAPGESVSIQIRHGVLQTGRFLLTLNVEALPSGGASTHQIAGHTEGTCASTLAPPATLFGPGGGNSSIDVTAPHGCTWDVSQTPSFASVTAGSTGTAVGTTSYEVGVHGQRVRRGANFIISNAIASVTQLGTVAGDFELDGRADPVVYRPSTGEWWIARSADAYAEATMVNWGLPGDAAVPADFDGDGKADPTVYREAGEGQSRWYINRSDSNHTSSIAVQWGTTGDVPVPGYYDYDAIADVALYRPSTGEWYISRSSTGFTTSFGLWWGLPGDVPVPADYDGDGRTDLAIYRPSSGHWFIARSDSDFTQYIAVQWGMPVEGDVPYPADYDGDGKADMAVYRPSAGLWLVKRSSTGYFDALSIAWGTSTDQPMPADFDGDGKADPTIYRPATGQWLILRSTSNYSAFSSLIWGSQAAGDVPVRER
jgi:FG-GAP-like repeat